MLLSEQTMSTAKRVYMDHAAGKPVDPRVVEAMLPYMKTFYGNPSSLHQFGQEARKALEDARTKIAELINAERKESIIFTSGATESNNMAIKGVAYRNKDRGTRIITSSIEHMSVVNPCKFLTTKGFEAVFLPVDKYGFVKLESLEKELTDKTVLVSIVYANGEIGTIEPIKEISKIVHTKNAYLHVDATAACGQVPIDVKERRHRLAHDLFKRHVWSKRRRRTLHKRRHTHRAITARRRTGTRLKVWNREPAWHSGVRKSCGNSQEGNAELKANGSSD